MGVLLCVSGRRSPSCPLSGHDLQRLRQSICLVQCYGSTLWCPFPEPGERRHNKFEKVRLPGGGHGGPLPGHSSGCWEVNAGWGDAGLGDAGVCTSHSCVLKQCRSNLSASSHRPGTLSTCRFSLGRSRRAQVLHPSKLAGSAAAAGPRTML